MNNLTVIIPIEVLDTEEKKELFLKAVSSVDDSKILVVGSKEAIEGANSLVSDSKFETIVNTSRNKTYPGQVNFALKNVDTKYFSVLEFDDEYSKIWFKNLQTYIENDGDETFAFLPLTEVVDYSTKESFGYANDGYWLSLPPALEYQASENLRVGEKSCI